MVCIFRVVRFCMFLPRDVMQARPMSSCGVCLSVCVSITFVDSVKTILSRSHLGWGTFIPETFIPNLGTLALLVLELFATYATDRQTDKSNAY